jgi:type II secretory pathway pseudopilin PulG
MERFQSRSLERGVSIVEAVLVVAVIALIVAIALPSLAASLRAAREARAIANARAIGSAQMAYYAGNGKFAIFNGLFAGRYLGESFVRRVSGIGASEIISDGSYRYKISYSLLGQGVTVDADPEARYEQTHRWFRFRIGRVAVGGTGGEGTMYYAPAAVYAPSPPASSYRVLG